MNPEAAYPIVQLMHCGPLLSGNATVATAVKENGKTHPAATTILRVWDTSNPASNTVRAPSRTDCFTGEYPRRPPAGFRPAG